MNDSAEVAATLITAFPIVLMGGAVPVLACGGCAYLTAAAARAGWGE